MIGTPASTSWLINSILVAVGMKSRSIWKPSRGPTSVTVTLLGMRPFSVSMAPVNPSAAAGR